MIRVVIADDHPEMRVVLRLLLNRSANIKLVCEAENGREAIRCVLDCHPDVLVMDVNMPEMDGVTAIRQLVHLQVSTRILLISTELGSAFARQAAAVGAHGFLAKDDVVDFLAEAIAAVHRGEQFFPKDEG